MKAAVYTRYGPPQVIGIRDVEKPVPKENQVLVKVRAASVNPRDWHFLRGSPYFVRLITGLRRPKLAWLGVDLAGQVEAVGANVTRFRVGDEVFGAAPGAFAEYACASESSLAAKPQNASFEQAAAVPTAALTALQSLRNRGLLQPGQKVLINGGAGGVGTFAVQIAKALGGEVTGVCSTKNVDMVRSIGADRVIDHVRENFTQNNERYDLMLDCIGNQSLSACRRVLGPRGIYIMVGGKEGRWIGPLGRGIRAALFSRFVTQKLVMVLTRPSQEDLTLVSELIAGGKVVPVIDRRYRLSDVAEAMRYLEEGHARGKVVITV